MPIVAKIGTEYCCSAARALISLLAFGALILVPAIGSFGRSWEKATAVLVSLFVLVALLAIGIAMGIAIVYYWDDITHRSSAGLAGARPRIRACPVARTTRKTPAKEPDERRARALSEAIESGAGLPAVARAAAAALGASVALIDRSSAVLAVAASSSAEEAKLLRRGRRRRRRSSCASPTRSSASCATAAAAASRRPR